MSDLLRETTGGIANCDLANHLTWPDAERLFGPECMVAFDRDIGPPG